MLNQYPVLPPIAGGNNYQNDNSERRSVSDGQQPGPYTDQEVPSSNESMMSMNNYPEQYEQHHQQPMMPPPEDTYLPDEPVLLTDFEEERLSNQIREQLGGAAAVDRLKLVYQELAAYDPNRTNSVHYSQIQMVTYQLGVREPELDEDLDRISHLSLAPVGRRYASFCHVQIRCTGTSTRLRQLRRSGSILRQMSFLDSTQSVWVSESESFSID